MILADYAFQNLDLENFARLTDQLTHAQRHVACQDLLPILRDPDKVIFDVVNRVTAITISHSALRKFGVYTKGYCTHLIPIAVMKSARLKAGV